MSPKTDGPRVDRPTGNPRASDPVQVLRDAARESQALSRAIEQAQAGERMPVFRAPHVRRRPSKKP